MPVSQCCSLSLNVAGLTNITRKRIEKYFRMEQVSILSLRATHLWRAEHWLKQIFRGEINHASAESRVQGIIEVDEFPGPHRFLNPFPIQWIGSEHPPCLGPDLGREAIFSSLGEVGKRVWGKKGLPLLSYIGIYAPHRPQAPFCREIFELVAIES